MIRFVFAFSPRIVCALPVLIFALALRRFSVSSCSAWRRRSLQSRSAATSQSSSPNSAPCLFCAFGLLMLRSSAANCRGAEGILLGSSPATLANGSDKSQSTVVISVAAASASAAPASSHGSGAEVAAASDAQGALSVPAAVGANSLSDEQPQFHGDPAIAANTTDAANANASMADVRVEELSTAR